MVRTDGRHGSPARSKAQWPHVWIFFDMAQEAWIRDRKRCRKAGIPDDVPFRTKPEQLRAMAARAVEAGGPSAWLTADEVYGQNPAMVTGAMGRTSIASWRRGCRALVVLATPLPEESTGQSLRCARLRSLTGDRPKPDCSTNPRFPVVTPTRHRPITR